MTALRRKLLRDLWHMRGQALAVCMVMACGVATFVMSLSALLSLQRLQRDYYERHRFAQVFTNMKRAPLPLRDRIAEIPGVAQVEARIVVSVTLDIVGFDEPVVGKIVSIPERRPLALNRLHLRSGRLPMVGRTGEVLVEEAFAEAHRFVPGDKFGAIINGRWERLTIVGITLSPEFIYPIREGDILPDNRRYGILWMGEKELAEAFDMDGAFNDVCLALQPGASEAEVLRRLDLLTERYGGLGAFGREDQTSHKFISNEISQLRGMGMISPAIFLAVAAFLLNVIMSRLTATQREQIAMLKAFGYSKREIAWHYLQFVLVLVLAGTAIGTAVGVWMGHDITRIYARFFRFPVFEYRLDPIVIVAGLSVSGLAAIAGTLGALAHAWRLPPAEALRPEPPVNFRPLLMERLRLAWLLTPATRMIVRQLERQPLKPLLSCLGISLAVAVHILGSFVEDSVNYVIDFQFSRTQRYDMLLTFREPTSYQVLHDIKQLPGIVRCEPFRTVGCRFRFQNRSRRLGILGVPPDCDLFQIVDDQGLVATVPTEGLLVSAKLAELLGFQVGDRVTVEVLEGERPKREIPITGLLTDFAGTSAYMNLATLHRMMREGDVISSVQVEVDSRQERGLFRRVKESPQIARMMIKSAAQQNFRATLAENLLRMRAITLIFASIIAVGVVYNAARISLSERSRDLATLRVIGFTRREISAILLGELAILTLVAIPFGLLFGRGFAYLSMLALDTETHRFPLVIERATYGLAVVLVVLAAGLSSLIVRHRLDNLDLVAVLKSRE